MINEEAPMFYKSVLWCAFLLGSACLNLEGVLSPLSQSVVEIKAIVEDKRLSDIFGESEEIESIRRMPRGYIVMGIRHQVKVMVDYKKQSQPGPKPFELRFLIPENK